MKCSDCMTPKHWLISRVSARYISLIISIYNCLKQSPLPLYARHFGGFLYSIEPLDI